MTPGKGGAGPVTRDYRFVPCFSFDLTRQIPRIVVVSREHTMRRTVPSHARENHVTMEVHLEIFKDADKKVKMQVTVRTPGVSIVSPDTFPSDSRLSQLYSFIV